MATNYHEEYKAQAIFRIAEKVEHMAKCLKQVDDNEVWWRPNASSNSVANILIHLCGNVGQYILASLGRQADTRQRDEEFAMDGGLSKTEIWTLFETTMAAACDVIAECSEEEMLRVRKVQGFSFSGLGVVLHAVEHLSYHTGQVAYLVKWRNDLPIGLYDAFDLNDLNED